MFNHFKRRVFASTVINDEIGPFLGAIASLIHLRPEHSPGQGGLPQAPGFGCFKEWVLGPRFRGDLGVSAVYAPEICRFIPDLF